MMRFLTIIAALLFLAAPAYALTAQEKLGYVDRAESYLQTFKTAKAEFIQTNHDGSQFSGTFYLNRPGRLRFDYDNSDDFVVADGFFIYFYDAELGEQTNAPIGQTLADFILRKNLKFRDDITVQEVKRSGGYIQITLVQTADPAAGSIILAFANDQTFALKKWRIVDPQELITEVELIDLQSPVEHPDGRFAYNDPKHGQDRGQESFND